MIKYMRHIFIFIVVWLAAGTICSFAQYKPDRLGEGFEAKTIVDSCSEFVIVRHA